DDVRLRVRVAAAPARLPGGDTSRRAGGDPTRAPRRVRRAAAEAPPVPRPEGGVLPRGLRARRGRPRALADRPGARARRASPAAGRLPLPPALEPALPDDAALPGRARRRARRRAAADGRAAGVRERARAAVGDRPGARGRCPEPDRDLRRRRLGRRDDEPRGGGARGSRLHDVRRPARRRRRGADPPRPARPAQRPARARAPEARRGRAAARAPRSPGAARPAPLRPVTTLRTDRLALRQWREADLEPFAELNADPEVMRYFPAPLTRAESDAHAERSRARIAERGW